MVGFFQKFTRVRKNVKFKFVLRLGKNIFTDLSRIIRCEQCISRAGVVRTTSSTDAMHVVLRIIRIVVVDHELYVFHIYILNVPHFKHDRVHPCTFNINIQAMNYN